MREVLGKKRAYEKEDSDEDITLSTDSTDNKDQTDHNVLKSMDGAYDELNAILKKQSDELKSMNRKLTQDKGSDIKEDTVKETKKTIDTDMDQLEKDLARDYDVKEEKKPEVKVFDSAKVFAEVEQQMNQKILGQKKAVSSLITAFRRPYVMGSDDSMPKNVILVSGPQGSGKHTAISEMAKLLYQRQIFISSDVYTIDLSRYTSGAQEQIFLQDMYEGLYGKASIVCFENFETCFPSFLRMINDLTVSGKAVLGRRYVLTSGVLVENQTGLVKNAVDTLSAAGKYLIFVTDGSTEKVQDAFGADFMYHVLDQVKTDPLDDASLHQIIDMRLQEMIQKCSDNLHIQVSASDDIKTWVYAHFDKTRGADSIHQIFYDFYVSVTQAVLDKKPAEKSTVPLNVQDDIPCAELNGKQIRISREKTSQEEIAAVNKELDGIVGLKSIKDYIYSLQAHIAMQEKRKQQGMKTASISKHMIFTGNPGTGKTTIARLISRYMKAIGALSQGQLVEVTRADLVAQYVGQTAPQTMSVIRSAIGGVLFIDEAYSLYRGKDDSFGLEAIDTLVKAMEDNRDNLIVIMAGYKKEMAGFLESNSGLKSRFPNIIDFPDYSGEELQEIAALQAKGKGYTIDPETLEPLQKYFDEVQKVNAAEAGNGRLARNVIEDAIRKQSQRLMKDDSADLSILKKEDFDFTVKVKPAEKTEEPSMQDLVNMLEKNK